MMTTWERSCFLPDQNRMKIGREPGRPIQLTQKKNDFRPENLSEPCESVTNQIRQGKTCRTVY